MSKKKIISLVTKIVIVLDILAVIAVICVLKFYKGSESGTNVVKKPSVAATAAPTETVEPTAAPTDAPEPTDEPVATPEPTAEPTETPEPTPEENDASKWAKEKLANLTLDQKILQMFIITPEELTEVEPVTVAGATTQNCYTEFTVGGIIFYAQNVDNEEQITNMVNNYKKFSNDLVGLPIFIAFDKNAGPDDVLKSAGLNCMPLDVTEFSATDKLAQVDNPAQTVIEYINDDVDLFVLKANFKTCLNAIKQAVKDGTISEERIDKSVTRILSAKYLIK